MRIYDRVDEAHGALASVIARLVDQSEDRAGCGRGCGCAVYEREIAVDRDDVVGAVGLSSVSV